jgi:hypothetical protein
MLPAIHFHDQPRFEADEVENVAAERDLPFELEAFKLLVADRLPQQVLGLRRIRAHGAGEGAMRWPCETVDQCKPLSCDLSILAERPSPKGEEKRR